jgi:hypothetical protein
VILRKNQLRDFQIISSYEHLIIEKGISEVPQIGHEYPFATSARCIKGEKTLEQIEYVQMYVNVILNGT